MKRLAINGYGRIGRDILRALYESNLYPHLKIVAINDLAPAEVSQHLTKYDSTHGIFAADVELEGDELIVNGDRIKLISEADPAALPWKELQIDLVLECSGKFKKRELLQPQLDAGAARVLVAYPVGDADNMVVYGVNHDSLEAGQRIVSNASCTTNCLAPMAKVLHEAIGIEQGYMTTIHAYTNDQNLIDKLHKDLYRSRSAPQSMIPTKTGAAGAVGKVLPQLAGKLDGLAVRVPTANVSLVDLVFIPARATSTAEVNQLMQDAVSRLPAGVLAWNDKPLVSVDFNHNPTSCIFDASQTRAEDKLVKVMAWYDNEWGYSNRMLDIANLMVQL